MVFLSIRRLALTFFLVLATVLAAEKELDEEVHNEEEEESEPVVAILFPFFALGLGVISYCMLTRVFSFVPYTAVMFLIGTFIGMGTSRRDDRGSLIHDSVVDYWERIDSEVLLVSFLPALIYHDSLRLDVHLFQKAFAQCVIMAFPMVLFGTALTALIAYYIFPYGWSLYLSLTFGAILSATDPVAVAALLEEVGAPPRIKIHIGGEALLNDGAAIVFFSVFSKLYLLEEGSEEGEDIGWGDGFAMFFKMSLGGSAIGFCFACGHILLLQFLGRRLNREENIVEVASSITVAYLCYFTAEVVAGTSGVIANLTLGVITRAFGRGFINDTHLLEDFWSTVEWILNTILFTLGGLVWGSIIANDDEENPEREFKAKDWGYLFLLYVLLTVIRFGLFGAFYPIISKIGLRSNWQEMVFQSFGGLRGAVGISLALFLDNIAKKAFRESPVSSLGFSVQTEKLFGFVGGIAFLTLFVNGVFAGPLLKKLGLTDISEVRVKIFATFRQSLREEMVREFVELLTQPRFHFVNFAVIRHHIPYLANLTVSELDSARDNYLKNGGDPDKLRLHNIYPYLEGGRDAEANRKEASKIENNKERSSLMSHASVVLNTRLKKNKSVFGDSSSLQELRLLFLELVRRAYDQQVHNGELLNREYLSISLEESVNFAVDALNRGERMKDWEFLVQFNIPLFDLVNWFRYDGRFHRFLRPIVKTEKEVSSHFFSIRSKVELCLAFMNAHRTAQKVAQAEFDLCDKNMKYTGTLVIEESEAQVREAEKIISSFPQEDVQSIVSHKFCTILLNHSAHHVEDAAKSGLLRGAEAEELVEEIEHSLRHIDSCSEHKHPGEFETVFLLPPSTTAVRQVRRDTRRASAPIQKDTIPEELLRQNISNDEKSIDSLDS